MAALARAWRKCKEWITASQDPIRVLILNPSGEEATGIVGKVLKENGAVVEELATQESIDLLVAGSPSSSVQVVQRYPSSCEDRDFLVVLGSPLGVLTPGSETGVSSRCASAGDPQTPQKVIEEIEELIRSFHQAEKPVLGICLGAQLVARSFGAPVMKMPQDEKHTAMPIKLEGDDEPPVGVEFGWHSQDFTDAAEADPVVGPALNAWRANLPSTGGAVPKFEQWHSDTFEFPKDSVTLSTRPTCPAQAFRMGRSTYAFQYHIEVDQKMAEDWCEDYVTGNDSYAPQEEWEGIQESNAVAMRKQLGEIIAEGSIERAEKFTRELVNGLLSRAVSVRKQRASANYFRNAFAVTAISVAVAIVAYRRRKLA